ncbi:Uncharacterised protein [Bordetella pertussis]|nr:Uncharacterised protein [Bordetella pertussis]
MVEQGGFEAGGPLAAAHLQRCRATIEGIREHRALGRPRGQHDAVMQGEVGVRTDQNIHILRGGAQGLSPYSNPIKV